MTQKERLQEACIYINYCILKGQPATIKYAFRSKEGRATVCSVMYPDGKIIVSKSGSGVDLLGAALGDIVEHLNPDGLLLALQAQPNFYAGLTIENGEPKVNGAAGTCVVAQACELMGYSVSIERRLNRAGKICGELQFRKV